MKNMSLRISLFAGVLLAVSSAHAGCGACGEHAAARTDKPTQESAKSIQLQTTCPVMGGKIDRAQYVDHDGKRIYICCKGCEGPLKQDPAKYIKKMEDAGITIAHVQTHCPVMGGKINKAHFADVSGKRIYVCCPGCIAKIQADPATYIDKLESAGVILDPADAGKR